MRLRVIQRALLVLLFAALGAAQVHALPFLQGAVLYQVATPTFSPGGGTYTSTQSVTITDSTPGSTIYYTTNGSTPTTGSSVYSGAITVSATETVKSIATAAGYTQSAVGSASYVISGSSSAIKAHFGSYMDSQLFTDSSDNNASGKAAEIAAMHQAPSVVLGYEAYYFWGYLEQGSTAGNYVFTQLDTDYKNVTGWVSGTGCTSGVTRTDPRRLAIYVLQTDYFDPNPFDKAIPAYLGLSSTYGPLGPDGVHYGYWTATGGSGNPGCTSGGIGCGSTAAIYRSAVMARYEALFAHLAAHVLPDGCTVDGSPYVEWIKTFLETASAYPQDQSGASGASADSTFSDSGYLAQIEALNTSMDTSFPHTAFATPANFTGPNGTQDVNLSNALPSSRSGSGGPDVFGASDAPGSTTLGQLAFQGLLPPMSGSLNGVNWTTGGTDQREVVPYVATVQCTELVAVCGAHYTPTDLFNEANGNLHARYVAWSYIYAGQYSGQTSDATWLGTAPDQATWNNNPGGNGGVLDVIYNNALTHTSCPSAYIALGFSCNTTLNLPAANDDYFHERLEGRFEAAA